MSILNYFFIGAGFTFVIDLLLGIKRIQNHPAVKGINWRMQERILCVVIWPLALTSFVIAFIKQFFK